MAKKTRYYTRNILYQNQYETLTTEFQTKTLDTARIPNPAAIHETAC